MPATSSTKDSSTFQIEFDYRFDESNLDLFTKKRKAVLEYAGELWSSYIQDEFDKVRTGETAYIYVNNTLEKVKLNQSIDDLLIFVSFAEINDSRTLAHANYIIGDSVDRDRDQQERIEGEDFEPWLGFIEFNAAYLEDFYFDSTPETDEDLPEDMYDFLTISLHEIGHVLGIGSANSFVNQTENGQFTGANSVDLNNGEPIPLDHFGNHSQAGFQIDHTEEVLLGPFLHEGERRLPSALDLAMLADIGYEINQIDEEVVEQEVVEAEHTEAQDNIASVHRFFQFEQGFHFYTANENERRAVIKQSASGSLKYVYESIAYKVLLSDQDVLTGAKIDGALPVYRFFNTETGAHFYTTDENEKTMIVDTLDNYNFEGTAYYAFAQESSAFETVPLYRMLNTQSGSHLFTTNRGEFETIQATLPHFQTEGINGITFHVLP